MKRFFWVILIGVAMLSMLCIGLVLGAVFSPATARIGKTIDRIVDRVEARLNGDSRLESEKSQPELQQEAGAMITAVVPGSPAERAGLQPGQLITAINGQPLRQTTDLGSMLAGYKPGDQVKLTVLQPDGEEKVVEVTLAENPDNPGTGWLGIRFAWSFQVGPQGRMPWMPKGGDGTFPDLPRRRFEILPDEQMPGLKNLQPGALIQEVVAGSPAEEAGLQPGQIIQAVDGKELDAPEMLKEIITGHEPGDIITLTILDASAQNEQAREVKVTLGENPDQVGAAWLGIRFVYLDFQRFLPENMPEG